MTDDADRADNAVEDYDQDDVAAVDGRQQRAAIAFCTLDAVGMT